MGRSLLAVTVAVALLAGAPAAPVPKEKPRPLYFPTSVGAKWVYLNGGSERTNVITAVAEDEDGSKVVSVGRVQDGQVIPLNKVRVSPRGLSRLAAGGKDYDAPMCLLKRPGEHWDFHYSGEQVIEEKETMAVHPAEPVTVAAGTFAAVRVEGVYNSVADRARPPERRTIWYAPGVGMVKLVVGGATVWELKSFTPRQGLTPPHPSKKL